MDPYNKIENIIQSVQRQEPGTNMILSEDSSGINTGVILLRSCPASLRFLQRVYDYGITHTRDLFHYPWETSAFEKTMCKYKVVRINRSLFTNNNSNTNCLQSDSIKVHTPHDSKETQEISESKDSQVSFFKFTTCIVPPGRLNAYLYSCSSRFLFFPNHFILHFAGLSSQWRKRFMRLPIWLLKILPLVGFSSLVMLFISFIILVDVYMKY